MSGKPKHGLSNTPEYRAWQTMRLRCTVPTNPAYDDYGARGITVCDRWMDSVENFIADMGQKPAPEYELDREKNNLGYSPENCRWVTRKVNDRNRRSNRLIAYLGETHALAHWCELFAVPRDTAKKRLDAGWTEEETFTISVRPKSANGHAKPLKHTCAECGANETTGARCRPCENRSRPRNAETGRVTPMARALINANFAHEREIARVA